MENGQGAGRGWTWFFWVAAIFNFAIGAAGMFAAGPDIDARIIGIFVFAFGIVYAVVAREPDRFATVLWAGVFGKVAIVALLVSTGLGDLGGRSMAVVLSLDVLFAFGFLVFLLTRSDYGDASAEASIAE